jgi:PLP dependent protein
VRDVAGALARVRQRIHAAALRAGRDPGHVTLVAVSKGADADRVLRAVEAGQRDFGENRVAEALAKQEALRARGTDGLRWHFVGRLQRNKVRRILGAVEVIHSVDRLELAQEIARRAAHPVDVLVEVNTSGEDAKAGVAPERLTDLVTAMLALPELRLRGLMTMAPRVPQPEDARPCFRRLAGLQRELHMQFPDAGIRDLSMGMSQDYEIAVEEGATLVRVGTAIFGPRSGRDDRAGALAPASLR